MDIKMKKKQNRLKYKRLRIIVYILTADAFLAGVILLLLWSVQNPKTATDIGNNQKTIDKEQLQDKELKSPEMLLKVYMSYIELDKFEAMYDMLDEQSRKTISREEFVARNQKIYKGMEAKNIQIDITEVEDNSSQIVTISYKTKMDTIAGETMFSNHAVFVTDNQSNGAYALSWTDSLIFPDLSASDKVRVSKLEAKRGEILDRDGKVLGGWDTASSVGIVPGKMSEDYGNDLKKLAKLLDIPVESIEKKLKAKWIKEDSFVPIKTIKKLTDEENITSYPSEETLKKRKLQEELIAIPGVMFSNIDIRSYPLEKAASHLTGYIQKVTAEDLKSHQGEGYGENSIIGRSGVEGLYEKELKGEDGYVIAIIDSNGTKKSEVACIQKKNGETIRLTVDAKLQEALYHAFSEDKSCSVALNPYTGEVLGLTSTPSFDSNDFSYGMSETLWEALNTDSRNPLYNRFRQKLCPGSSFKPIIAAIGLETGDINPLEDYGNVGLSWQKDTSWGKYSVTTLHAYEPVVLENALIYSDNIYFAKVALKIGIKNLQKGLDSLGFNKSVPFEIKLAQSQYSNNENIESEIQLADSGYGQGQILVNPVHMAALLTGFANEGNILKPYLLYQKDAQPEVWLPQAYSKENAGIVKSAMSKVISSTHGTGHAVYRKDIALAGKTGTAEIKLSKADTSGTELGWFSVFTLDKNTNKPILIVTMVEDVKNRGGSGYVVKKIKQVLDEYFSAEE